MRLIDADALEKDAEWSKYEDGFVSYSQMQIDNAPTIAVVPLIELLKLRDWLYESDGITMGGLRSLNELVSKFSQDKLPKIETGYERFVLKGAYDQVRWERDLAIWQLQDDYGVGFGEKKILCADCKYRDPEDGKCDHGGLEHQGLIFKVADDYYCRDAERRTNDRT